MSEKDPSGEPTRFSVSHEQVLADPGLWGVYWNERWEMRKAGQPVWILRSTYTEDPMTPRELGPAYDYYVGGDHRGQVEGTEQEGFQIYLPPTESDDGPQRLNSEPIGLLSEAQKNLADYTRDVSGA